MKKIKSEKVSTIKNRIKKLCTSIVRCRDKNKCQRGNKPCCIKKDKRGRTVLHPSHIYPVGLYPWMAFDPDNVKLLCYWHHFQWWHKSPIDAAFWLASYLHGSRVNNLMSLAQTPVQVTKEFLYEREMELLMEVELLKEVGLL